MNSFKFGGDFNYGCSSNDRFNNDVVIKRTGEMLELNKEGLLQIIGDNLDNDSNDTDNRLTEMIRCFYDRLSVKQILWIMEKVKYVIRNNGKYKSLRGIKDIRFI
jgi:hypothetical protein